MSSSDVDYLNNTESLQILQDATSSGAVDLQNPSNNIDENLLFDPTCETKGNPLEGALPIENSDQFVQFISLGNTAEISKPLFHEKQSVCNPVMVNSNLSHTTNTVSSTTSILNQVADMKIVDGNAKTEVGTKLPMQTVVHHHDLPQLMTVQGTSGDNNLLQMLPVKVLTGTTSSSQVYVLSMTISDDEKNDEENQTKLQEQVANSILVLDKDIQQGAANIELKEPQRSSTPKFDELLNDTIIDGHLAKEDRSIPNLEAAKNAEEGKEVSVMSDEQNPVKKTENAQLLIEHLQCKNTERDHTGEHQGHTLTGRKKTSSEHHGKENINMSGKKMEKITKGGHHKRQLCVADILTKASSPNDVVCNVKTHNATYCNDWVSNSFTPSGQIAQNDMSSETVEQDSCDSSLLNNVTSVSQSRWVSKKQSKKTQVHKQSSKTKENDNM